MWRLVNLVKINLFVSTYVFTRTRNFFSYKYKKMNINSDRNTYYWALIVKLNFDRIRLFSVSHSKN